MMQTSLYIDDFGTAAVYIIYMLYLLYNNYIIYVYNIGVYIYLQNG